MSSLDNELQSTPTSVYGAQSSELRLYSLGIAANNREIDDPTGTLMVTPIEALTMLDGEIGSSPFKQIAQGIDADGQTYQTKVETDLAISCTWIGESNRRTPPDVRRGERILIFRYADRDKFLWQSLGLDDHLRKLETVVYSISGTADEKKDGTQPELSYFLEMSSHKGSVTLSTSQANGEFTSYALQIDAKNGKVTLADNLGNSVMLNSADTVIEMKNADDSYVSIDKKKIYAVADTEVRVKTKKFQVDAEETIINGKLKVSGESNFGGHMTASGINSPAIPITGPFGVI